MRIGRWIGIFSFVVIVAAGAVAVWLCTGPEPSPLDEYMEKTNSAIDNDAVMATVNGEAIYRSSVVQEQAYYALSKQMAFQQIPELSASEEVKQYLLEQERNTPVKTLEEVLQDFIRDRVLLQEAQAQGVTVDEQEAYEEVRFGYELVKQEAAKPEADPVQVYNYRFVCLYMDQHGLTEQEYLQKAAGARRETLIKEKMFAVFCEKSTAQMDQSEARQQFELYVDSLVEKAEVVIL